MLGDSRLDVQKNRHTRPLAGRRSGSDIWEWMLESAGKAEDHARSQPRFDLAQPARRRRGQRSARTGYRRLDAQGAGTDVLDLIDGIPD